MKNSLGASLGICAVVVTYLALGVLSGFTIIWGIFGAWGTYYTNAKGTDNVQKTIGATVYGAVLAGVAVILHGYLGVAGSFAWPIAVGLTVYAMTVLVGNKHFANVPGVVFGYTMAIGYMLTAGTADTYTVTALSISNPIILMSISFVFGAIAGLISEKFAGTLSNI